MAGREKEQHFGWLLLFHLRNRGRQSICTWHVYSSVVVALFWYLSNSLTRPHPIQWGMKTSAVRRDYLFCTVHSMMLPKVHYRVKFTLKTWVQDCQEITYNVSTVIQQLQMYIQYNIQLHTYIHTDTSCTFNMLISLRLVPIIDPTYVATTQ